MGAAGGAHIICQCCCPRSLVHTEVDVQSAGDRWYATSKVLDPARPPPVGSPLSHDAVTAAAAARSSRRCPALLCSALLCDTETSNQRCAGRPQMHYRTNPSSTLARLASPQQSAQHAQAGLQTRPLAQHRDDPLGTVISSSSSRPSKHQYACVASTERDGGRECWDSLLSGEDGRPGFVRPAPFCVGMTAEDGDDARQPARLLHSRNLRCP